MPHENSRVTIWFLSGVILFVYGWTIFAQGIYNATIQPTGLVGASMHLDLWWGFLLGLFGATLMTVNWPGRLKDSPGNSQEGSPPEQ